MPFYGEKSILLRQNSSAWSVIEHNIATGHVSRLERL